MKYIVSGISWVFPSFSILRISLKKIRFLVIFEATVYSETPGMSNACGQVYHVFIDFKRHLLGYSIQLYGSPCVNIISIHIFIFSFFQWQFKGNKLISDNQRQRKCDIQRSLGVSNNTEIYILEQKKRKTALETRKTKPQTSASDLPVFSFR